jgi:alkanesulfonate monooxygenase
MSALLPAQGLKVFSTCPPSARAQSDAYLRQVEEIARWSEEAGCEGILVYADNGQVDPWLVSQVILRATRRLCPLVAVQPVYMHPYSVAKMLASIGFLHRRRVYLNMVAGGFKNDLEALDDRTPHDERYARLAEYTTIIQELLRKSEPVTFDGRYYRISNLKLAPPLPADLQPGILVSGSSPAGMEAARRLGAIPVEYPKPPAEYAQVQASRSSGSGIRVGIIARAREEDAWSVAHARFPVDRKGQLTHHLAMKVSDSSWHKQLSEDAALTKAGDTPYWLWPFENYKTFCPYLVGDYDVVSDELAAYIVAGYETFILDIPADRDELSHAGEAFKRAARKAAAAAPASASETHRELAR